MEPLLLAIETSTRLCSVALARGARLLAVREADEERLVHAEKLHVFIDEVLREGAVHPDALNAVAVGIGPGSYTGLRIGLSAAKGLCYALDIPIIGIGSLDVLSLALRNAVPDVQATDELHPMIDARRMEVFAGSPPAPLLLDETWVDVLDPGQTHIVFGDGADKATALWNGRSHVRHVPGIKPWAAAMLPLALRRFAAKDFDDLAYLIPAYGKDANVTRKAG